MDEAAGAADEGLRLGKHRPGSGGSPTTMRVTYRLANQFACASSWMNIVTTRDPNALLLILLLLLVDVPVL